MAKELTANFSANTGGFSSGVAKLKNDLTNLNKALDDNKRAVSEANKEVKQLEKEKKQLDEAMKDGATKEQAEQMEKLETALAQAKSKAAALKTEQAELKVDIRNTTKSLEEQKSAADDNSKSFDKVKESASSLSKTITTVAGGFTAAVGALGALTASAGATADDINTLSKQYGLSTEQIQKFKYATDLIDVSLNTYTASIARNIRSMTAYQNGTAMTVQAYDRLGVAVLNTDGTLRDSETVYNEVIAALGRMEDETQRDSIALTLLGRSALELNPLILGGAEALAELGDQAESLGLILPQEQLDNLNAFNDKVDTLKANMNALKLVGAESFAGSFDSFFEAGDDFVEFINQLKADGTLDEMAKGLSDTLSTIVGMLKTAITVGWEYRDVIAAGAVALVTFKTAMSIGNIIAQTTLAIKSFSAANQAATVSQQMLNTAVKANPYVLLASVILSVVSAVATLALVSGDATDKVEELKTQAEELSAAAEKSKDTADSLSEIAQSYSEIADSELSAADKTAELKSLQEQLNSVYGTTKEKIDLVNGSYESNIALLKEVTEAEIENARIKAQASINAAKEAQTGSDTETATISTDSFVESISDYQELARQNPNINVSKINNNLFGIETGGIDESQFKVNVSGTYKERAEAYKDILDMLESVGKKDEQVYTFFADKYEEYTNLADDLAEKEQLLADLNNYSISAKKENLTVTQDQIKSISELNEISEANRNTTKELVAEHGRLTSAISEQNEAGQLSLATAMELIDSGYSSVLAIDNETGAIRLNIEAYRELNNAKIEAQKQALLLERRELRLTNAHLGTMAATAAQGRELEKLAEIRSQISANDKRIAELDATEAILEGMGTVGVYSGGSVGGSSSGSSDNRYTEAYNAYKTEADKKLELITRELEAKRKLRDETIAAIDEEIEARKRLNEDKDLEEEINAITAQLKYSQLDEFSRSQLENKLDDLYEEQAERNWQRQMQDKKEAANESYAIAEERLKASQESINDSIATFKAIMDALSKGITNINNVVNNSSTSNNTANLNLVNSVLTEAQITRAVKRALMDDIVTK